MRLALVTHSIRPNDGQGGVNDAIVREALRQGWEVTLIATEIAPDLRNTPGVTWIEISAKKFPSRLLQYQVFALKSAAWLRQHRSQFDIVNVNGFITWANSDVNAVHFVHSGWLRSGYYPFSFFRGFYGAYQSCFTRLNAAFEKKAFASTQVVVAVSDRVAKELRDAGVKTEIKVIYNGSDVIGFSTATPNRAFFNIPEDKFLCLFAGDLKIARKNLDTVLHALVKVPDHIELVVAGTLKGSPYPALAKALGLEKRVHFAGHVTDMKTLMASCDCLVFPSRYDPFALVVLEAMAAGMPVVTSSKVGAAALVEKCGGIVLEDPDDVDGLAGAISRIEADPAMRTLMQQAAKVEALNHTWEAMSRQYIDLYERIVKQRSAATVRITSTS